MAVTNELRVVGQLVSKEATDWDQRMTGVINSYVQMGKLLIEGRDNQYYRDLGSDTLEEYCKEKAGMSWANAKMTIADYLVQDAICRNISGAKNFTPKIRSHVSAIKAMANLKYEKREVTKRDGSVTFVKQPIGVKNEKAIADQWTVTVKEFNKRKKKAEDNGTRPPTFSGKFVRNMLPNEYKVTPDRGFNCNPLVLLSNRLTKLNEWLEQNGCNKSAKLKKLVLTEPPAYDFQLDELKAQSDEAIKLISAMRELLEEYEEVDSE